VRALATGDDGAPAAALVRDGDVRDTRGGVACRPFADDGVVRGEAVVDGGASADAPLLLAGEGGEDEFGGGVGVAEGDHRRREAPFHVRGSAAVEAAVTLCDDVLAAVRDLFVGGCHHVVVADEGEGPGAVAAPGDHVPGVVAADRRVRLRPEPRFDGIARRPFVLVARDSDESTRQIQRVAHASVEGCPRFIRFAGRVACLPAKC